MISELSNQALFKRATSIQELFEYQASEYALRTAATCDGHNCTYQELNEQANQLAHYLIENGAAQKRVAIYMDRSIRTVIAILATIKAGAAYVPIELAYPSDRVQFMLEDCEAPVVLTEESVKNKLPQTKSKILVWEEASKKTAALSTENPEQRITRESVAYIIYTSGSTGKPKGVQVTHHNVLRLFEATDHWYGFNEHDTWSLFHSFAFDFSVWELWGALLYGGKVVVVPYIVSRSPQAFYELLEREQVTVLNQTPSAFRQLIAVDESASRKADLDLRYVIFGGEALVLSALKPWFARHGDKKPQLVNMYGITETTVHVTYRPITSKDVEAGLGSVIGEPIPDLQIHILDEQLKPVAKGTPGEICVGGEGVALGYLNRPELTAQRFINNPFSAQPAARLYRSGDLARELPNGDLEYLGRIDHQVKIRGFRIELGDVEAALNSHPAVRESVVIAHDGNDGDKRLVAYLVCRSERPSVEEIRSHAGKKIPAYMIPAVVMYLDALPLTVNGKIDRKALPSPDHARPVLDSEYVAPSTPQEIVLATVWQEILQIDQIGVHDNFFALGGDSIRSIQILAKAQEAGLHLGLQALFEFPTIHQLAKMAGTESREEAFSLPPFALLKPEDRDKLPAGLDDAYPMAKLQTGMVFHSDFDKTSAIFHDVFSFRLRLPYNEEVLKAAVDRLVLRHTIFRTSFDLATFTEPLQLVHSKVTVPFSSENLMHLNPQQQKAELVQWVETEKRVPFNWKEAPFMRLHVQRYADDTFQFIVSFHHAIMDGWSLAYMLTELFQDYSALLEKKESNIQIPKVNYRDFVLLEKEAVMSPEHQNYWKSKLRQPVVHQMPRWPSHMCKGGKEQRRGPEIYFKPEVFQAIKKLATSLAVPIRTPLLAAHCKVMSALTGQTDIITGLVANGRPQATDGERLIGLFLNTLPLRVNMEGSKWRDLIKYTFEMERELLPFRRSPLAEIQQLAGGQALFETAFDFVQFHVYEGLPGYKDHSFLEDHYFEANSFTFFTTFMVDASGNQLQMHFDYNPNFMCEEQISFICQYFVQTLEEMVANPEALHNQFSVVPPLEMDRQLVEWNATAQPANKLTLPEMFVAQVKRTPDAISVVDQKNSLTYKELNNRVNYLAGWLQQKGVGPETMVGVHLPRTVDMLAATLAVCKAGGAYIPLDPNFPGDRLAYMLEDAQAHLVLSHSEIAKSLNATCELAELDHLMSGYDCSMDYSEVAPSAKPENLAYVIYTSGSTGKPKGVQLEHRSLTNFLESMKNAPGITSRDALLAITTLSFDIAGLELFLPIVNGAKIILATSEEAKDPTALISLIEQHQITFMQATPTTWRALLESNWKGSQHLKALCGGESLPSDLAAKLLPKVGELWNMYGPTETTIWSTVERISNSSQPPSIGRPIANTEVYILDKNLLPVPVGTVGELFIGGGGLARGYLHRPELTAERFVKHPFAPNARLYRTGDLGYYLPDGRLICAGRIDHQVKVRGFRIELGEIESVLSRHPGIQAAVVTARPDSSGHDRLIAYYIPAGKKGLDVAELREHLAKSLPEYMIPSAFAGLAEFPLTPNGKIDKKALPEPQVTANVAKEGFVAPRNELEQKIAAVWRDILNVKEVGVTDNFFGLGGHSLLAMQVAARLKKDLQLNVPVSSFFKYPVLEKFANNLDDLIAKNARKGAEKAASTRPVNKTEPEAGRKAYAPLSEASLN
ncbi:MAG: amino acid adenylation domain-containing protein [Verrucomicrobiales bacterium]